MKHQVSPALDHPITDGQEGYRHGIPQAGTEHRLARA